MARQAKTKGRRATKKSAARPLITPALARRLGQGVLWIATLGAIPYGVFALERYAADRSPYRDVEAYPTRVEWVDLPGWLADERYATVLGEIQRDIDLESDADAQWDELCSWVHHRAEASAWVARVQRVSKLADNTVRVQADFRKPMTYVFLGSNAYLVDREGVQLWPALPQRDVDPRWLPITGTRHSAPGIGRQWQGVDRAAGLALVRVLNEAAVRGQMPHLNQLRSVNVADYRHESTGVLRLETVHPDVEIVWGKAPGREYDTEAGAEQKIERLRELLASDGPRSGRYDLRPADEIWFSASGG